MLWPDKAKKILSKYWGIDNLKDKQFEVINSLLLGNDVVGLLPTGYGKSMCYLIPPLVTKKIMFIISPLISLMEDQKEKLNNMGIPCSALHGNNKNRDEETFRIMDNMIKIVYMSPEYLINGDGMKLAQSLVEDDMLGFLAIDESHCISGWGHDFRPEYAKIKIFRENFPDIPILAVTATATEHVCSDIIKVLKLKNPITVRASFDRPNLHLKICEIPSEMTTKKKKGEFIMKGISKENVILPFLDKYPNEKIIIYINNKKETEEISAKLNKLRKNCSEAYHAGLNKNLRETIQHDFSTGKIKIIISTIAFGMGIDQIVRCVLIFGCPSSIEEYYQQIGRGGRDDKPCETILYFEYSKLVIGKFMLKKNERNSSVYKVKMNNLDRISNLVYVNTCRRKFILEYFNEKCDFFICNNCDNCKDQELVDMTDIIWSDVMKPNCNLLNYANSFKTKYLIQIIEKSKAVDISQGSDLFNSLWKWKQYILENKIKKEKLPDKLKIMLPKKFINTKVNESFEEKISYYENMLNN